MSTSLENTIGNNKNLTHFQPGQILYQFIQWWGKKIIFVTQNSIPQFNSLSLRNYSCNKTMHNLKSSKRPCYPWKIINFMYKVLKKITKIKKS